MPDEPDILTSGENIEATVEIMEGYITLFPLDHFVLRSTPSITTGDPKKKTISSILNKDGGIINASLGRTWDVAVCNDDRSFFGFKVGSACDNKSSSFKFVIEPAVKIVEAMINNAVKDIPVWQGSALFIYESGTSSVKGKSDDGGLFKLEVPFVYDYVNHNAYTDLFGTDVKKGTFHIDLNVRLKIIGQGYISVGGTVYSDNHDLNQRVYASLSIDQPVKK